MLHCTEHGAESVPGHTSPPGRTCATAGPGISPVERSVQLTTNRHSDVTNQYQRDVLSAARELGYDIQDTRRPHITSCRHSNGNRVFITPVQTKKDAEKTIKTLLEASGTRLPLSDRIANRPRRRFYWLRTPLNRSEMLEARGALMSHLNWIDTQIDTIMRKDKPNFRELQTKIGLRELLAKELKRVGVHIYDYVPEEARLP